MKIGFDNQKYLKLQSERILERVAHFGGKLYLEFGGKLFDDYHASRVLPGFQPDSKMKVLLQLKEQAEIVIAINAAHIEMNKRRGDLGITYDLDVMRLIEHVPFHSLLCRYDVVYSRDVRPVRRPTAGPGRVRFRTTTERRRVTGGRSGYG